jgi:hypothetical protein
MGLMGVVLIASNRANLAPYTGLFAGGLVALYITTWKVSLVGAS